MLLLNFPNMPTPAESNSQITTNPFLLRKAIKLERVGSAAQSELATGVLNRDETICRLILSCVSTFMEVNMTDLMYHNGYTSRDARGLCCYLMYKHTNYSYQKIGQRFRRAKSGVSVVVKKMQHTVEGRHYPELTQIAQLTENFIQTFVSN